MFQKKPGLKNKMSFFRLLAVSQKAGLNLRDSLIAIRFSEKNKIMYKVIDSLINQISEGKSLPQAMSIHRNLFSVSEIGLIESAQVSGNMVSVLEEIFRQLEDSNIIKLKIKKATIYPVVLLVFSAFSVVILLVKVVPTIVEVFPNKESLPSITLIVLGLSDFFQKSWYIILFLVLGIFSLYKMLYRTSASFKMFIDKSALRMPIIKDLIKNYYMYMFSSLLGQFYKSGLNPVVSLGLIANIFSNSVYNKKVLQVKNDMSNGFTFFEAMEGSPLFDSILVQILHVGEETGTIGSTMSSVNSFYKDNLNSKIEVMMGVLEPLLIAIMAVVIGVIIAAIFLPMTTLLETIN